MRKIKSMRKINCFIVFFILVRAAAMGQGMFAKIDAVNKKVSFGNAKMRLVLDYDGRANIAVMTINGQNVIDGDQGVYSALRARAATMAGASGTQVATYSSLHLLAKPVLTVTANAVLLTGIVYGDKGCRITEGWKFVLTDKNIRFELDRTLSRALVADEAASPVFLFKSIDTWEGAYQGYGGLAWFYLFNKKLDTYGVHSNSSQFWNSKTGIGLEVVVAAPGAEVAMDYSRTADDRLAYGISVTPRERAFRYDSGTHRRRYVQDSTNVWAPFTASAGTTHQTITLSCFDFNERYGRGKLNGVNGDEVSAVLNTIARIGVIDKQHFGGNSWHTPYGPICLHEQYIAQMGLAINDPQYLKGYQDCLDYYRDNAIKADGRVWPRWAYTNEDMMPGEVTDKGFYEARWGYLLDANPDLVTNVAELYDQTGDKSWVKTHQASCEKALDWIMARDANHNGLVEMVTDSHTQRKGSDWIDIIWASYENAFVNAKLYHALVAWVAVETQLGNTPGAARYAQFAAKLKNSFNKPVSQGGFWDAEKGCYIHWREKDGSVHGDNMVTPVNFMAIGYGICEDAGRQKIILDAIEAQMQKEQLFFWPICLSSYQAGDGNDWQFPFPKYENGDIFLSWGAMGVKAYASYKPELALKYVKNVLQQYAKDGLAFQRYGRDKQDGLGDDILSGNSLSVVGLYQAIYGINPKYNRMYLDPHITAALAGTSVNYRFRGQRLAIGLSENDYSVSDGRFTVTCGRDFGYMVAAGGVSYFNGAADKACLRADLGAGAAVGRGGRGHGDRGSRGNRGDRGHLDRDSGRGKLILGIKEWGRDKMEWTQLADGAAHRGAAEVIYQVDALQHGQSYTIRVNGKVLRRIRSDAGGRLRFGYGAGMGTADVIITRN
jgi:hypothetical protein